AKALVHPAVSDVWKQFIGVHSSGRFARQVFELFVEHLPVTMRLDKTIPDFPRVGIRGIDAAADTDLLLDAQISLNTPVLETSSVKGPHVDRAVALYAGLYYLRGLDDTSEGGELELYRRKPGVPV